MAQAWDTRRTGRAWRGDEARTRWELTPEKFEMHKGKLFFSERERCNLLALLWHGSRRTGRDLRVSPRCV